jgi:nitrite reductase/ring-hydroxylating ferredoxin subunit
MEWRSTMAMKLLTKNDGKKQTITVSHYLVCQMSKWFYDISTGSAIGVARCGSFVWRWLWSLGC